MGRGQLAAVLPLVGGRGAIRFDEMDPHGNHVAFTFGFSQCEQILHVFGIMFNCLCNLATRLLGDLPALISVTMAFDCNTFSFILVFFRKL